MPEMRSLTVMALRSAASADATPPPGTSELLLERGGEFLFHRERSDFWMFLSPTDAVLAGLDACADAEGAGVCVGIALGELCGHGEAASGEPVDEASTLCSAARPRQVLMGKGVSLSVNHSEVFSHEVGYLEDSGGKHGVVAYEASRPDVSRRDGNETQQGGTRLPGTEPGGRPEGCSTVDRASSRMNTTCPSGMKIALLAAASIVAAFLLFRSGFRRDHLAMAREAATAGESLFALEQAELAWKTLAGEPELARIIEEQCSRQSRVFLEQGRPYRAFRLLRRFRKLLPFSDVLDEAFLAAGTGYMRKLLGADRKRAADDTVSMLIRELPGRIGDIEAAYLKARLDYIETAIAPVIASGNRRWEFYKTYASVLDDLDKKYPDNGRIMYLWARLTLCAPNPRLDDVTRLFDKALSLDPSLSSEKAVFDDLRRVCELCGHRSARLVAGVVKVMSGLSDSVTAPLAQWLTARHSIKRKVAYSTLEARGALPADRSVMLEHHSMNARFVHSAEEKAASVDAVQLANALAFFGTLRSRPDVRKAVDALESLSVILKTTGDKDLSSLSGRVKTLLDTLNRRLSR